MFTTRALLLYMHVLYINCNNTSIQTTYRYANNYTGKQSTSFGTFSRPLITSDHSHNINIDRPHNYTAESTTYR